MDSPIRHGDIPTGRQGHQSQAFLVYNTITGWWLNHLPQKYGDSMV